jgi:hypothetical protein
LEFALASLEDHDLASVVAVEHLDRCELVVDEIEQRLNALLRQ